MVIATIPDLEAKKRLAFDREEYRGRLADVRAEMARRGLETLLVHTPENVFYPSGHRTPGYYVYQCLVVPSAQEPFILVRRGEVSNVQVYAWLDDVVPFSETVLVTDWGVEVLTDFPRELRIR